MTRAPKITGDVWFNSLPLESTDISGKVVLYDFWTYSCVNCQRTLPYLKAWWQKLKDSNFLIIGIHTPEFEFEKDPKNVAQAIEDLKVDWPVVLDNDYKNWNNFSNHYWPAKYLSDTSGKIVYTHFGEGNYAETEAEINKLLGLEVSMPVVRSHEHERGNVCFIATPETYCGYERGALANTEGYSYDSIFNYVQPKDLSKDSIALSGKFLAKPEFVESGGAGATIFLRFSATEVNLVMHPAEESVEVEVVFDGERISDEIRGQAVSPSGIVKITKPTLYNLIKSSELVEGVLSIKAISGNFRAYAFTFSGCK